MTEKAKLNSNKRFPTLGSGEGWRETAVQPDTGVTRMDRHPALAEDNAVETPGTDQHLNASGHCSSHCFPTHWGTQAPTHSRDFQPQVELGCSNVPACPQGQLTARNKAAISWKALGGGTHVTWSRSLALRAPQNRTSYHPPEPNNKHGGAKLRGKALLSPHQDGERANAPGKQRAVWKAGDGSSKKGTLLAALLQH